VEEDGQRESQSVIAQTSCSAHHRTTFYSAFEKATGAGSTTSIIGTVAKRVGTTHRVEEEHEADERAIDRRWGIVFG
jgi:hypothetical protein